MADYFSPVEDVDGGGEPGGGDGGAEGGDGAGGEEAAEEGRQVGGGEGRQHQLEDVGRQVVVDEQGPGG